MVAGLPGKHPPPSLEGVMRAHDKKKRRFFMYRPFKSRNRSDNPYDPSMTVYPEMSEFKVSELKNGEKMK
jgi:hypothetical protein